MTMTSPLVTFVVNYKTSVPSFNSGSPWRARKTAGVPTCHGKPSTENLAKYVEKVEASTLPGGCNDHLAKDNPFVITEAWIVDQRTKEVVARWYRALGYPHDAPRTHSSVDRTPGKREEASCPAAQALHVGMGHRRSQENRLGDGKSPVPGSDGEGSSGLGRSEACECHGSWEVTRC